MQRAVGKISKDNTVQPRFILAVVTAIDSGVPNKSSIWCVLQSCCLWFTTPSTTTYGGSEEESRYIVSHDTSPLRIPFRLEGANVSNIQSSAAAYVNHWQQTVPTSEAKMATTAYYNKLTCKASGPYEIRTARKTSLTILQDDIEIILNVNHAAKATGV